MKNKRNVKEKVGEYFVQLSLVTFGSGVIAAYLQQPSNIYDTILLFVTTAALALYGFYLQRRTK
ncbi:MAG: hypothetical protein LBQ52_02770 [Helicobacteraceae bacterium]|jgi:hypothetical protein|nr:hypothetical protein [Helicobacteraceae bacterium]